MAGLPTLTTWNPFLAFIFDRPDTGARAVRRARRSRGAADTAAGAAAPAPSRHARAGVRLKHRSRPVDS
jgi:hypothetical protein